MMPPAYCLENDNGSDVVTYLPAIENKQNPYTLLDENLQVTQYAYANSFSALRIRSVSGATVRSQPYGAYFADGAIIPESVDFMNHGCGPSSQAPGTRENTPLHQGEFFFMGRLFWHFGHFFNDSCMRFWALSSLRPGYKKLVFVLDSKEHGRFEQECSFFREFFTLFDIDIDHDIVYITESATFEMLHVPSCANAQDIALHPFRKQTMTALLQSRRSSMTAPGQARIYMSRADMPCSARQILNDDEVQKTFRSFGFSIIHAYRQSILETVDSLANVQIISGSMGSGWNNLIFAPNLHTAIVLLDKNVNVKYTYASPIQHTRFLVQDFWGCTGTLEPAYTIGSNNYLWFSTPSWANIDVLRKQLSFILKEKPSKTYSVPQKIQKSIKCRIYATLAESMAWYNLYDDALFYLSLAWTCNDINERILWAGPLQQLKKTNLAKNSLESEGMSISFTQYPELQDAIREHAEDEDYIDRYAQLSEYLKILVSRLNINSMQIPPSLRSSYAIDPDEFPGEVHDKLCPGKRYDCVLIDGHTGYVEARRAFMQACEHLTPGGIVIVVPFFPYLFEYHFRVYNRHSESFYTSDHESLDTWKLAYDIFINAQNAEYITINGSNGIFVVKPHCTALDSTIDASITSLKLNYYQSNKSEFMHILHGRHFLRLMRGGPPLRSALFESGFRLSDSIHEEFGFASNDVRAFYHNRYHPPGPAAPYRLAEYVAYAYRLASGADIAIACRGEPASSFYIINGHVLGDPKKILPQGNTICIFECNGSTIESLINTAIEKCSPAINGFYPYISGADTLKNSDNSLTICHIGWKPFQKNGLYTLAINSYFASGAAGYEELRERPRRQTGINCACALADALSRRYPLSPTPAGNLDSRKQW